MVMSRGVCTTERLAHALKNPNGSFHKQAIISSQTMAVRNTLLSTTRL